MRLFNYFQNSISSAAYSFNDLLNYTTNQYNRMVANNPGAMLNTRINATSVALNALDTGMADNATKLAIQKSNVQAKETYRETLAPKIARIHGAVVAAYGDPSPQLTECFPLGRSVFMLCSDGELNDNLTQLVTCITPRQSAVGAAAVNDAAGLLSTWIGVYAAANTAKSYKKLTELTRKQARANLEADLFKNLLTLALNFPGDEDKFTMYVPEYLLLPNQSAGTLPELASLASNYSGGLSVPLTLHAEGATHFQLSRRMVGEVDFTPLTDVPADANSNATYTDTLPAPGHYEYQTLGQNDTGDGPESNIVLVTAD